MKVIKQFLVYLLWILVSLLLGIIYMRFILGKFPSEEDYNGLGFFLNLFYSYSLVYVGIIIGGIIAFFFIIVDYFLLRERLRKDFNSTLVRILVLLIISIIIGIVHYFLEKVIDVI